MTLPASCDSAPPHREGPVPAVPAVALPTPPFGTLVGAVSEAGTSWALPYATIDLTRLDGPAKARLLAADSVGGFALEALEPGTYRFRVRSFDHRFNAQDLRVRSAVVETLLVVLRYFRCTGY